MNKRSFIKQISLLGVGSAIALPAFANELAKLQHLPASQLAGMDDFWEKIRAGYKLKPDYINLENGYYCFMPEEILEKTIKHLRYANLQGSYYLRTTFFDDKKAIKARLAKLADCSPEELVITRNSTEALDMIIAGTHWNVGDEAIYTEQDYGAMQDMFVSMAKRYGIVNKVISIPNNPASDEEIVALYEKMITKRTKLILVTQLINITGHILPVRKICDMAHSKGVEVLVDGAHAFAHIPSSMKELGCDYYGASLHKWLSTALGAGMLFVKKEKIEKIWPLMAEDAKEDGTIERLSHTGTTPVHSILAIGDAIDFHTMIGSERKEERLRYIQNYWVNKVKHLPKITMNTPEDPKRSCAIANVGIKGIEPKDMAKILLDKYKIWTVAIDRPGVKGCRITPNIYTTTKELDVLVKALTEMSS